MLDRVPSIHVLNTTFDRALPMAPAIDLLTDGGCAGLILRAMKARVATMKTLVEYMYRDASNYKEFGSFVLEGDFEISAVQEFLADDEFFIPERVGVKSLVPAEKTVDDHYFHTLEATSKVDVSAALMSAELFVERIKRAGSEGWFYEKLSGAERQAALVEGQKMGLINPAWDG